MEYVPPVINVWKIIAALVLGSTGLAALTTWMYNKWYKRKVN